MQVGRELPHPTPELRPQAREVVVKPRRWPLHSGRFDVSAARSNRIEAIDAVRGMMMIAIAWSHALITLDWASPVQRIGTAILSGTIGFTTISGLMVGWFAVIQRNDFARIRARYALQAKRLVFIVHPLIVLALWLAGNEPGHLLKTLYITDALAMIFWLVVPIVPRLGAGRAAQLGIALLIANAFAGHTLEGLPLLHDILCGVDPRGPHVLEGSYGLLPLTGAFLIGSWFGTHLAAARTAEARRVFSTHLAKWAACLIAFSLVLVALWFVARRSGLFAIADALYPDYEQSLYPFYAGATLLLLGVLLRVRVLPVICVAIGKASLFIYVAQYVVVHTLPGMLGWYGQLGHLAFVLLCVAVVPVLGFLALAWNRWRANADRSRSSRPDPGTPRS